MQMRQRNHGADMKHIAAIILATSVTATGAFAQSAARALIENTELEPEEVVSKALGIAADLCIYTNHHHTIEVLD